VPNVKNHELFNKYQELAQKEKGVIFVGRLASYKYFNMDQAILNALEMFDHLQYYENIGYWHNWVRTDQ
jgi:UDP-galactopyranose mutase